MRHLTRLYYDNLPVDGATDLYISVVDQGIDDKRNPLFSVMTGPLPATSTLADQYQALRYLLATACFFKLPVGASATIDIYVPDEVGSTAPKTIDYKITKAFMPKQAAQPVKATLNALKATFEPLISRDQDGTAAIVAAPSQPNLVSLNAGAVGPCCYNPSPDPNAPCGSETKIACPDPLTQRAFCNGTNLVCIDL